MVVTNARACSLSDAERNRLEVLLADFERSWGEGRLAEQVGGLAPGPLRFALLVELVKIDLERNWQAGRRVGVESYLRDYPELGTADTVPADLLQAEYEIRRRHGEADLTQFERRFPARADELRRLLGQEATLATSAGTLDAARPAGAGGDLPEQFGRYRIVRRLGQGGMGTVYLAHDTQLGRAVALKVPRFDPGDRPETLERFHREARAAAALRHPNICPVYDVGQVGGRHYLTMAYIEGPSLAERIKTGPALAAAEAVDLVRRLALAVAAAHAAGIVHRDLKPANVLLGPGGEPVVTDFGLARRADEGDARLTRAGAVLGTPAYMAPEQADGDPDTVGPACDVYALGVILYELLTGRTPFVGLLMNLLWQIKSQAPPRPSALRPDIDPELEGIVMRALEKKACDRFPSMSAFAAALAEYQGRPPRLAPDGAPPARPRRVRALAALAGAALLVACVALILSANCKGEPMESDPPPGPPAKCVIAAPKKLPSSWDVTRDGTTLVRVYYHQEVELWDTATGALKARLKAASEEAGPVSSSDDSRLLAVGSHKRVTVWDLKKHKELFEFKEPAKQVDAILFLPGGKRLLGVARDGSAWEWDLTTGKVARTSGQLGRMTSGFCVSADRRTVFALKGLPNTVQLMVNTADLSTQAIEVAWSGSIRAPAVSPDGKQLILGESEEVKLYDVERRKTEKVHHLHTKWISPAGIDVHWESKLVASGSEDHTAVVWDLKVGKERFTCKGFDGPVGVQFSPDGKTLFAWADNGTRLRRWDVASGKELQPVDGHDGGIRWAGFRSGGSRRTLIVYEHDGKVTFYDLSGLSE